jgi:aminoglycoside phosphotransferase (APT) family kinase protein
VTPETTKAPKRIGRLYPGQRVFDVNEDLVRRLLAAQFPEWADATLDLVGGWDNTTFRLGNELAIRLPWGDWAVSQREKEHLWLPRLAAQLPIAVPEPLAMGRPGEGYPWPWSVYRWLEGEEATFAAVADPHGAAMQLAEFLAALWKIDPDGGPTPGRGGRGEPLARRDGPGVRAKIAALDGLVDAEAVAATWDAALQAEAQDVPAVWVHGDLHAANLLLTGGRLSAVIDWGCCGVADPACDLLVAWMFLDQETRVALREELAIDDAMWARGRGWTLIYSLPETADLTDADPDVAGKARESLARLVEVTADFAQNT